MDTEMGKERAIERQETFPEHPATCDGIEQVRKVLLKAPSMGLEHYLPNIPIPYPAMLRGQRNAL
jgi:hypothetical protein